jgi:murein DD-endopeptidase MepM/ murein hydrolase activator NlpD
MPLDNAQWQIDILAADKTASGFASVERRLKSLQDSQTQMAAAMRTIGTAATSVFDHLKELALGYLTVETAHKLFETALKSGELAAQAEQVGINTDQLQAYRLAGAQVGVQAEQMDIAITKLAQSMGAAAKGDKQMIELFNQLGVKILDSKGQLRSTADVLPEVAAGLLKVGSSTQRTADEMTLFGRSGAKMTTVLAALASGNEALIDSTRKQNALISPEAIEGWDKLSARMTVSQQKWEALVAEFGAQIALPAIEHLNGMLEGTKRELDGIQAVWKWIIENMDAAKRADIQSRVAGPAEADVKNLQDRLDALRQNPTQFGFAASEKALMGQIAARQQALQQVQTLANQSLFELDEKNARRGQLPVSAPPLGVTATGAAGASNPTPAGSGERDRIGEELRRLTGEADSAREAYERLQKAAATASSTEDLQREVSLQKAIGDELARIGKYSASDPRVPQLKQIITEHETWEYRLKSLDAALKAADATEKQFGDGTAEFTRRQTELNEAFATGRLSADAYSAALKAAQRQQEDQARTARGAAGGFDALVAGVEQGAADMSKANANFEEGKRLVTEFTTDITNLATGAETDFGKVALSFGKMLLQMELQAAASNLFNSLSGKGSTNQGLIGSLLSGLFGGGGSGGESFGPPNPYYGPGFAGGGDTPEGTPFVVGENGPEVLISGSRGHVYNQRQLAGMGGGDVYVSIANYTESKVSTRKSKGPGGQMQVDIIVEAVEAKMSGRVSRGQGALGKTMESTYGLQRRGSLRRI